MKQKHDELTAWIKKIVKESGAKGIVVGMSGGIDSSVVAALCKKACKNTLGLIIPCHSNPDDAIDAQYVANKFKIKTEIFDITEIFDVMVRCIGPADRLTQGNLKARLRMCVLYYTANRKGYLVAGSSNKSEISIGYFTKYGDGAADFFPIGNLLKKDVIKLAEYIGIPKKIINKKPSAGLWSRQTDEDELGFTYKDIDEFLSTGKGRPLVVEKIRTMMKKNAHKRCPVPVPD